MSDPVDEKAAARALTEFLTKRDGYNRLSPIETAVQARIQTMLRELATEVVRGTPGLAEVLRDRVKGAVAAALREDGWLNRQITESVAKVLTDHALEREQDE